SLSLHDALPIWRSGQGSECRAGEELRDRLLGGFYETGTRASANARSLCSCALVRGRRYRRGGGFGRGGSVRLPLLVGVGWAWLRPRGGGCMVVARATRADAIAPAAS